MIKQHINNKLLMAKNLSKPINIRLSGGETMYPLDINGLSQEVLGTFIDLLDSSINSSDSEHVIYEQIINAIKFSEKKYNTRIGYATENKNKFEENHGLARVSLIAGFIIKKWPALSSILNDDFTVGISKEEKNKSKADWFFYNLKQEENLGIDTANDLIITIGLSQLKTYTQDIYHSHTGESLQHISTNFNELDKTIKINNMNILLIPEDWISSSRKTNIIKSRFPQNIKLRLWEWNFKNKIRNLLPEYDISNFSFIVNKISKLNLNELLKRDNFENVMRMISDEIPKNGKRRELFDNSIVNGEVKKLLELHK